MLLELEHSGLWRVRASDIEGLKQWSKITTQTVIDFVEAGFPVSIRSYGTTIKLKK